MSSDSIHKMLVDRDPVRGRDLPSQSTLSRFEIRDKVRGKQISLFLRNSCHFENTAWFQNATRRLGLPSIADTDDSSEKVSTSCPVALSHRCTLSPVLHF